MQMGSTGFSRAASSSWTSSRSPSRPTRDCGRRRFRAPTICLLAYPPAIAAGAESTTAPANSRCHSRRIGAACSRWPQGRSAPLPVGEERRCSRPPNERSPSPGGDARRVRPSAGNGALKRGIATRSHPTLDSRTPLIATTKQEEAHARPTDEIWHQASPRTVQPGARAARRRLGRRISQRLKVLGLSGDRVRDAALHSRRRGGALRPGGHQGLGARRHVRGFGETAGMSASESSDTKT